MSDQHDYDGIKYRDEIKSPGVFRILFVLLAVWGVLYMGYYLFSGWSSQAEADAAKKAREERTQSAHKAAETAGTGAPGSGHKVETYIAAGKQLYGNLCAACHGEAAKGGVGPDLTISKYKYGKDRLDITKSVAEGRPGGMPAFSNQIDREQVESIVEYVLSLK